MQDATRSLRRAFGSFMTGVTVVTTTDAENTPIGFTANSFTSVSIDPPLLLVCPGTHLQSFNVFESTTHFAISILAEGQESISNTFASGPEDRFAETTWKKDPYGSPLIDGACATFSCRVHQRHMAGDHLVLIGEVLEFQHFDRRGLGYGNNGYFSLSKEQQADRPSLSDVTCITGAIIRSGNKVMVVNDQENLRLPAIEQSSAAGARSALQAHFDQNGIDVSLGPVYSIYDDATNHQRYTFFLGSSTDSNASHVGTFTDIDSLNTDLFTESAQAIMMQRFVTEVRNNVFGLYIGDTESGDVHHQENKQE